MRKCIILVWMCLFLAVMQAQNTTISGFVADSATFEPLPFAHVYSGDDRTVTNENGFFSIHLSSGNSLLSFSYVGYKSLHLTVKAEKDTFIHVRLKGSVDLDQVVVHGAGQRSYIGSERLNKKAIEKMPTILGEHDVLKNLQFSPGIHFTSEGKSELVIRGGNPDQLQTLLDDVPVYYLNHIGGFLSLLDNNTINSATFFKSGFFPEYGGKLSGVLDVTLREGSKKNAGGEFSVGNAATKLYLETPLIKDTSSLPCINKNRHSLKPQCFK
jgi:hypothetical protein